MDDSHEHVLSEQLCSSIHPVRYIGLALQQIPPACVLRTSGTNAKRQFHSVDFQSIASLLQNFFKSRNHTLGCGYDESRLRRFKTEVSLHIEDEHVLPLRADNNVSCLSLETRLYATPHTIPRGLKSNLSARKRSMSEVVKAWRSHASLVQYRQHSSCSIKAGSQESKSKGRLRRFRTELSLTSIDAFPLVEDPRDDVSSTSCSSEIASDMESFVTANESFVSTESLISHSNSVHTSHVDMPCSTPDMELREPRDRKYSRGVCYNVQNQTIMSYSESGSETDGSFVSANTRQTVDDVHGDIKDGDFRNTLASNSFFLEKYIINENKHRKYSRLSWVCLPKNRLSRSKVKSFESIARMTRIGTRHNVVTFPLDALFTQRVSSKKQKHSLTLVDLLCGCRKPAPRKRRCETELGLLR
ncbi:uncharacterized protein LOC127841639 [Dreissena polymorpha]|uniref:Uncharacterized protein n=1 Tax=Dreissena polymorpha TaxID=45954 RepID=A0A9D4N3K4_DREPO|nr:uncharacterized protein LOC127841639 [Dreissena polymorpha]KAH3886107.1 hypothetical protein DPMN_010108 [Dreissena polymorpha]